MSERILRKNSPQVFAEMKKLSNDFWKVIVEEWILTMFLKDFCLADCSILWDQIFCKGIEVFYMIFAKCFEIFEEMISELSIFDPEELLKKVIILHNNTILNCLFDIRFTNKILGLVDCQE